MDRRTSAASAALMDWGYRLVWVVCIGVYLTVFISGVQAGASELTTMARAMGFTFATAVIGRIAMGIIGGATVSLEQPPLATQDGTVGSLVDVVSSPTLAQHTESQ